MRQYSTLFENAVWGGFSEGLIAHALESRVNGFIGPERIDCSRQQPQQYILSGTYKGIPVSITVEQARIKSSLGNYDIIELGIAGDITQEQHNLFANALQESYRLERIDAKNQRQGDEA